MQLNIEYLDIYDREAWGDICYACEGDAGFDLRASIVNPLTLSKTTPYAIIPCGIKIEVPRGMQLEIRSRSGLAAKHGVFVVNAPGTIDSGYRGEIGVILGILSQFICPKTYSEYIIRPGDRIAQGVLMPYAHAEITPVKSVDITARGSGGFGHTGVV